MSLVCDPYEYSNWCCPAFVGPYKFDWYLARFGSGQLVSTPAHQNTVVMRVIDFGDQRGMGTS